MKSVKPTNLEITLHQLNYPVIGMEPIPDLHYKRIMNKTYTKGDVIVEDIKIGDIHYEYEYGMGIKCEVITLPKRSEDGYWSWKSKNCKTGEEIEYGVREGMSHYGPSLYTYEAYQIKMYV